MSGLLCWLENKQSLPKAVATSLQQPQDHHKLYVFGTAVVLGRTQ